MRCFKTAPYCSGAYGPPQFLCVDIVQCVVKIIPALILQRVANKPLKSVQAFVGGFLQTTGNVEQLQSFEHGCSETATNLSSTLVCLCHVSCTPLECADV